MINIAVADIRHVCKYATETNDTKAATLLRHYLQKSSFLSTIVESNYSTLPLRFRLRVTKQNFLKIQHLASLNPPIDDILYDKQYGQQHAERMAKCIQSVLATQVLLMDPTAHQNVWNNDKAKQMYLERTVEAIEHVVRLHAHCNKFNIRVPDITKS